MDQSPMGWYEDDDAPGLARWWDGDAWTEHTMAIPSGLAPAPAGPSAWAGSRAADDTEPLPPRSGPTRFPRVDETLPAPAAAGAVVGAAAAPLDPTAAGGFEFGGLDELDMTDNPFFASEPELDSGVYRPDWLGIDAPAHRRRGGPAGQPNDPFARRYLGWPLWARITAPGLAIVCMVALALAAVHASRTSSTGRNADTSDATFAPPSSSTTAVTFVPLGPASSVVDSSSTSAPASTTSTTAVHASTTKTTVKATTTTAPPTTTPAPPATSTTTTSPTTTTEVPVP